MSGDAERVSSGKGRLPAPLLAMIAAAPHAALVELYRALAGELFAPPSATECRLKELFFLAWLLEEEGVCHGDVIHVERKVYDASKPAWAPRSRALVDRYGSWVAACVAANGLKADGRSTGGSISWAPNALGLGAPAPYTYSECLAAVRECAFALGRLPSSWLYAEWVRRRRLNAWRRGVRLRLPHISALLKHFPARSDGRTRWQLVLEAASISDEELAKARQQWFAASDGEPSHPSPGRPVRASMADTTAGGRKR